MTHAMRLALILIAPAALAQPLTSASPIPEGAEARFCYYDGRAYSPDAYLLIDVPFRRESNTATQKMLLACAADDEGTRRWVQVDVEGAQGVRR